jgi:hypothetical protein
MKPARERVEWLLEHGVDLVERGFSGSDRDEPRLGDHAERGMPSKATLGLGVGSAGATIAPSATGPPRKFAIASR